MPTINTGNALGAKVLFAAQPGSSGLPYADDSGAISISANGGATIGTQSSKLVFQTDPSGSKYFSTTSSPVSADGFTIAAVWTLVSNPGQDSTICSISLDDTNHWFLGVQQTFGIWARSRSGGTAGDIVFGSVGSFGTYYTSAAIFESGTARRLYHEGSMSSDNTTSVSPTGAGRKVGIGVIMRTTPSQMGAYYIRNLVIFSGALTEAELDSWMADPDQIYASASAAPKRSLLLGVG